MSVKSNVDLTVSCHYHYMKPVPGTGIFIKLAIKLTIRYIIILFYSFDRGDRTL